jgi:hypothetical protein
MMVSCVVVVVCWCCWCSFVFICCSLLVTSLLCSVDLFAVLSFVCVCVCVRMCENTTFCCPSFHCHLFIVVAVLLLFFLLFIFFFAFHRHPLLLLDAFVDVVYVVDAVVHLRRVLHRHLLIVVVVVVLVVVVNLLLLSHSLCHTHTCVFSEWDADDLAKEARLAKKLKMGRITQEEYDAEMDGDSGSGSGSGSEDL